VITRDYNSGCPLGPDDRVEDLRAIAGVRIDAIALQEHPNLLVFPDSFAHYDSDFGQKRICSIAGPGPGAVLSTNSIVGFVGRNNTRLTIRSRFAGPGPDCFLHYMLRRVAGVNLLRLPHTTDDEAVFDFLIYLFPAYLKKALSQGLCKEYVPRRRNDANLRGVIDPGRHIRRNIPFNGRVAYTAREHTADNSLTQLIRHTIDAIGRRPGGDSILAIDPYTRYAVAQIVQATPSFQPSALRQVVNNNLRPAIHPFYSRYVPLRRLCLQILRHQELKYGQAEDQIYGVLIDAAWLWEEYLALVLKGRLDHCLKDRGPRYHLFQKADGKRFQQIIPDYLSPDKKLVADAKYIPLDNTDTYHDEERATAIYYKTLAYMYRFRSPRALLLYPRPAPPVNPAPSVNPVTPVPSFLPHKELLTIIADSQETPPATLAKLGLPIPSRCPDFATFASLMAASEQSLLQTLP